MDKNIKISICIPTNDMDDKSYFLGRCLQSIAEQTYQNFEIILSKNPGTTMAYNTNSAIKRAQGDIVKILFMDDFLAHPDALKNIVDNWKGGWLVTGCTHSHGKDRFNDHLAVYNDNIHQVNTIGSPSVLAFANDEPLLFDERMNWMLDADLYKRLHARYGEPTILNSLDVVIGIGKHQTTNLLTDEEKNKEVELTNKKHA